MLIALRDKDGRIRRAGVDALLRIGESKSATVAALIPLLNDKEKNVRMATAYALGKIGEKAAAALPALRRLEKQAADYSMGSTVREAITAIAAQK